MSNSLIREYTAAVLDFELHGENRAGTPIEADVAGTAERSLRLVLKSGNPDLVLFGLGDGELADALKDGLPDGVRLLACDTDPATARAFLRDRTGWNGEDDVALVATDTSPWALLYLLALSGVSPDKATLVLNPGLADEDHTRYRNLQRLFSAAKPHQAINSSYLSHVGVQAPDLSVGAILKPDEPGLADYFAQFPDWVREVVVIWDAETVPEAEYACAAPVRQFARPLDDFASQRNYMLDQCEGDWVLYLDGDERFSEDVWGLFTACMLVKRLEACWFPRMTLYPDETRCKAGYGMWPDLQLRLFRNRESVRFTRPVHERLTGVEGRTALALDAPILHYSRLNKTPEELAAKLKRFDEAGGGVTSHLLNDDYPTVRRALMPEPSFIMGSLQMLLLEENPA